ncbi:hypothetical protein HMPREF0860_0336 [Treponema socranskii subsp. socranskii VPI DR56BR1116 = ATCC 35536]|uniref:Lipoprotein n=1 Tax=Treponema socranskii subsp. socranskii VPI DR56BR1116 = ATCC 35536 TaxID=1125725 RepID=A0ABP2YIG4_TRESO|nr:hypothetical protein HMPREF0860_0336 [Treponema socranskii subsp. socranskii VPI DR56BR1116 = ATCC 35536]
MCYGNIPYVGFFLTTYSISYCTLVEQYICGDTILRIVRFLRLC